MNTESLESYIKSMQGVLVTAFDKGADIAFMQMIKFAISTAQEHLGLTNKAASDE